MPQEPKEITLAKEFAAALATPIFIVDPEGNLLYYNPPAEVILGRTFEKTGEMAASVWSRLFVPTDEHGVPLMPDTLPLMIALSERHPAHKRFLIRGIDNVQRDIEVTAFPLIGQGDHLLGGVAIFWEVVSP